MKPTISTEEARAQLGIGETELCRLIWLGKKFRGLHPTQGGLYPTYKLSHKNRRITIEAIHAHMEHKRRLEEDPKWAAQMKAKARTVDNTPYGRRVAQ